TLLLPCVRAALHDQLCTMLIGDGSCCAFAKSRSNVPALRREREKGEASLSSVSPTPTAPPNCWASIALAPRGALVVGSTIVKWRGTPPLSRTPSWSVSRHPASARRALALATLGSWLGAAPALIQFQICDCAASGTRVAAP